MVDRIKANITVLIKYLMAYWSSLSALACVWLAFISWDDMGISGKLYRLLVLLSIFVISVILAVITVLLRKRNKVFGDINKGLELCYGDIMKIGFPKKLSNKRIIVIPVNRCFDLSCDENLVSRKSIHGQWIEKFLSSNAQQDDVHQYIQDVLEQRQIPFELIEPCNKKSGYLRRYSPGTVVEIKGDNNVTYYLLALSKFDEDLRAYCSEIEFYKALHGLVEYYDAHGQGEDLYCPIMGDHIARPIRNTSDIISFMVSFFRFNQKNIHGKVHMVVYNKMKSDISILDY